MRVFITSIFKCIYSQTTLPCAFVHTHITVHEQMHDTYIDICYIAIYYIRSCWIYVIYAFSVYSTNFYCIYFLHALHTISIMYKAFSLIQFRPYICNLQKIATTTPNNKQRYNIYFS